MKSDLTSKYVNQYAMSLAKEGKKLIEKAYRTANFKKDKTQNLHDSYGCAVYYDRKYVYGTKQFLSQRATEPRFNYYTKEEEYGFNEINRFLDDYKPKTDGFELVIAVAMFYGYILESGKLTKKYRVISGIDSYLEELKSRTGGKIEDINPDKKNG